MSDISLFLHEISGVNGRFLDGIEETPAEIIRRVQKEAAEEMKTRPALPNEWDGMGYLAYERAIGLHFSNPDEYRMPLAYGRVDTT